jgi:hypothetical protein
LPNEVDFVVVGSGIGGLAGAIRAADGGLTVLVLERSSLLGGVSSVSFGELWVAATHLERAAGIEDSAELAAEYLDFLGAGHQDKTLQARFLQASPEALQYYEREAGVEWHLTRGPDGYYPTGPGSLERGRAVEVAPISGAELGVWADRIHASPGQPAGLSFDQLLEWGGFSNIKGWDWGLIARNMQEDLRSFGAGLMAYFVKAAFIDRSISVGLDTRVEHLLVDDSGAVNGVRASRGAEAFEVRARRGVLLATGGYDWNPALTRAYTHLDDFHSACPPIVTGDHLAMGAEIGAEIVFLPPVGLLIALGFSVPGETYEDAPVWRYTAFEPGAPHIILLNDAGERFCDEAFIMDHQVAILGFDTERRRYRNLPAFLVFDQNHRDKYPLGPYLPGQAIPESVAARADDIRGLADALGIDADGFERTVKRFNDFAAAGVDEDFGRGSKHFSNIFLGDPNCTPNPNLGPLEKPPYYGIRMTPGGVGISAAGLRFDEHARVRHMRGHAIRGLYVTGNAASHIDIGPGAQSGITNTRGMTWGYVAGTHAAAQ